MGNAHAFEGDDVRAAGDGRARPADGSFSTTTASAQTAEGYWQSVQKSGTLRCGAAVAPPYVMRDPASGEYSGFFADLCREFAEVLKVKPAFVDTTWDNIVAGLQAGKWDMSLALNRTPARATACMDAPCLVSKIVVLSAGSSIGRVSGLSMWP